MKNNPQDLIEHILYGIIVSLCSYLSYVILYLLGYFNIGRLFILYQYPIWKPFNYLVNFGSFISSLWLIMYGILIGLFCYYLKLDKNEK